jgi:hypothetical protein
MLMINDHFARFRLPGNLLKTKKMCSLFSWQHAISYLFFLRVFRFFSCHCHPPSFLIKIKAQLFLFSLSSLSKAKNSFISYTYTFSQLIAQVNFSLGEGSSEYGKRFCQPIFWLAGEVFRDFRDFRWIRSTLYLCMAYAKTRSIWLLCMFAASGWVVWILAEIFFYVK